MNAKIMITKQNVKEETIKQTILHLMSEKKKIEI